MRLHAASLASLLLAAPVAATTWHVPGDVPTVSQGLGAASPGDTVEIACGTYLEHDLVLKSGVVVRGETGAAGCVVLDAGSSGRIAIGMRVTGAVLEGITFRGGFETTGLDHGRNPAAVPGQPEQALAPPDHDYGGGGALFLLHPDITIRNCRFAANEAVVHGGALRVEGGAVRLEDVAFLGNVAGNQGGALHAAHDAHLLMERVRFEGNRAAQGGGAYLALSRVDALESVFRGNRADGGGGALQLSRTEAVLSDCAFLDNEARRGGAIAMYTVPGTASLAATGCTFAGNAAATGAAIAGPATLARTILAFHRDGPVVDCTLGDVDLSCCDVFGNEGGNFAGCLADESGADGNFSADPLFCNLTAGILAIADGSPCAPASSPCGQLVGAGVAGCPETELTHVDTAPTGLRVLVDYVEYTSPADFVWTAGSEHVLSAPGSQSEGDGTRASFVSWSDGGAATHEIVVPEGGGTYVATYDAEFRLETAADGAGTVEPAGGWYAQGAVVDILATAEPGAEFAYWSGDGAGSYSGTSAAAQVTMAAPIRQTAHFAAGGQFTLTMTSEGEGAVSPASGPYPAGVPVGITAIPAEGWELAEWQGTGAGSYSGPQASATVTMYDDITQHAVFRPRSHTVTMIASGHGAVTPPSGIVVEGTQVTIRATPDPGYTFAGWIGTGPGSYTGPAPETTIVVWGSITQTAVFEGSETYPLTMIAGAGGTVSPASGVFPTGSFVTIEATPEAGHAFVAWAGTGSGSYTGASPTAQVRMLAAITQTATFRPLAYRTLTMSADSGGTVSPSTGAYPEGTVVTITAFPDSSHTFLGWLGTGVGSYSGPANPATVTLSTTAVTQRARFGRSTDVTVTTTPSGQPIVVDGVEYVSPRTFSWIEGSVHWLTVPAAVPLGVGQRSGFHHWSDGIASLTRTVVALPGRVFTAEYRLEYLLTQVETTDGTLLPGTGWHAAASAVNIDALPARNRVFESWTGSGPGSYTGPGSHATVTMNGPIIQAASFPPLGFEFSLSASDTDPWMNAAAATGGPRGLHLWLTCADHGISALEATLALQGNLQILGFEPVGNVLNAGGSANLLLAIGNCPSGDDLPRRLGRWFLQDGGGSACLGSGLGSGYAAVECDPVNPGVADDPLVVGFASDGSAPCRDGERGCPGSTPWRLLTMSAGPGGSVTPGSGYHPAGTQVLITAVPAEDQRFVGWTGSGAGSITGTTSPAVVTLSTQDVTQHAEFAADSTFGTEVTVTTEPEGLEMIIDGVTLVSPQSFLWDYGSQHTLAVPEDVLVAEGERRRFRAWADGIFTATRVVTVEPALTRFAATYDPEYLLTFAAVGEGTTTPGTSWQQGGSAVLIEAFPGANHVFGGWSGEGPGAYTGTDTRATVVMDGPITETVTFAPLAFEFSLSASDTDPWANMVAATNAPRDVHLWLTCAEYGISAMEATLAASGNLQVFGFQPVGNVLNAGSATSLLLAVGGCPTGADLPIRLGRWSIMDDGGALCLGAGASSGYAAVECNPLNPGVAENPVVVGFSSDGSAPCVAGEHGCGPGGGAARMAVLRAGWNAAPPVVTEDALRLAPNPFRGAAEITLSLKADARVRLDVYDVAGRLVRRVTDETLPAGILTRRWDSRDVSGRVVPAGIYFVKLDTSTGFHAVRKLVFLGAR